MGELPTHSCGQVVGFLRPEPGLAQPSRFVFGQPWADKMLGLLWDPTVGRKAECPEKWIPARVACGDLPSGACISN